MRRAWRSGDERGWENAVTVLMVVLALIGALLLACSKGSGDDITGKPEDEADTVAPEAISDLRVQTAGEYELELVWTAPADSGNGCEQYDLRMADSMITESNFAVAAPVTGIDHPRTAGSTESKYLGALETGKTYFFAIKTRDQDSNWSALSNCLEAETTLDSVVSFVDPVLEQLVRQALNQPTGELRRTYLRGVQALNADALGIEDLSGLEYCVNLRQVNMPQNQIDDIRPLAELSLLRIVNLIGNQLTSVAALAGSNSLEHLLINHNPVTSATPLGTCSKLTILRADDTEIRDFAAIASLPDLTTLNVAQNELSDLEFVRQLDQLTELRAQQNQIRELSPLVNLSELQWLVLASNQISDLTPLLGLRSLQFVDLSNNQITDLMPLVQNPGIGAGDYLNVSQNPLSDEARQHQIPALVQRGVSISY